MNWTKKQFSTLAVVAITSFMGTFLISSINIALPAIEKSFELDAVSLSWVITSFLLATAILQFPVGKLGDISGIERLYKIGLVIFTVSSLLNGLAVSGSWLIVFRFIQGVGAALTNTTGSAILVSEFPPQNRGRVLGISVSAVYLGLAFGPFAGGIITQHIGWRFIFFIAAALGLISTVFSFIFLKNEKKISTEKISDIDFKGTIFFVLGLIGLVYGSSQIPALFGWVLMMGGVFSTVVFWLLESRAKSPMIDVKLYTKNRLFAFSNLAALINYTATSAIVFFLSLYLQKVQGFSPQKAGTILIAQPIMMAVFSPIVGRLSDRIQPRYFATIGMAMCAVGLAAFAFLTAKTPIWVIVTVLIWVGLGFALFSSPNMNTIMSSVNKTQYGQASGSAASMRVLGQITSMTIVTLIFASMFGNKVIESIPDALFLQAMKWGFLCFSLIGVAGVYFSFNRGNLERKPNG
ncbi:Drug resistance transporter, EmrB/QacA subfamily [uncultured Paludibacter sp.]|uniref:Drug resistance transporter, EmrB/QacA subfamily n=1 Tax=uncultured Paludibacter sp. TaxID=497635 RepID=A0A653AA06_9BACT|nr:Drug resistance transporter, EmrB/QacA subfamily [uncultured Paludibacter sp.]